MVEYYQGEQEPYFINVVNEIFVASKASVKHYKFQNEGKKALHVALSHIEVKNSGQYESYTLQKGGRLARNETHVNLKEENAEAFVNAAYCISGETIIDTTTNVEHLVKNTHSNQVVRGVIDQKAHGVFQGKIHIAPNAIQTSGHQVHKALLLSDNAQIDVKPELEIFADDVKCSHGAASGDLNADEMFYLQSRGINEPEARNILVDAFLRKAFEDVPNAEIKKLCEEFLR